VDKNTKQRYISTSIWTDEWFDSLSGKEKLIYFNLLTNTQTNAAGVYPLLLKHVCGDTGLSREDVNAAMRKFEGDGKAFYHKGYIVIPKWMKHQKLSERSTMFLGAIKILRGLPGEIRAFLSDRRHYDFDVGKYVDRLSAREGDAHPQNPDSLSIGDGVPMPNSPHDLDLDLDSDLDPEDLTAPSEPSFPDPLFKNHDPEKPAGKPAKPKKPPLREREPENAHETVEKAYRRNWDRLCAEGKVRTRDPVVNWAQARKLLSTHFAKGIAPEKIVEAINNGLKDDFVMQKGYSLSMMLSATMLNGLLNSTGPPGCGRGNSPPSSLAGKKSLGKLLRGDLDEPFGDASGG